LESLGGADLQGAEISYLIARDLLYERLAKLDSARGQHQADGVVVSLLQPMRAVPFRVIFILGLGEGSFPGGVRDDPLDLRQAQRRAGDVSPSERDRYLFLETLLSAREALYLSYLSRDPHSGEALEPSALIRELQYILRGYLSAESLAQLSLNWPLSAFDSRLFPHLAEALHPELLSISSEAERGGRALLLRRDLEQHLGGRAPEQERLEALLSPQSREALMPLLRLSDPPLHLEEEPPVLQLPLYAIQRFLESPLQGSARFLLGLHEEQGLLLDEEAHEPLTLGNRQRLALLREAFWMGGGDLSAAESAWRAGFELHSLRGEAPVGLFAERRSRLDLNILKIWHEQLEPYPIQPLSGWIRVALGRAPEGESVDESLPMISLRLPLSRGGHQRVEIFGSLLRMQRDCAVMLRCILSRNLHEKHFLPGFLSAAALSAAGGPAQAEINLLILAAKKPKQAHRCYRVPGQEEALAWFGEVVTDLLKGVHSYRLPIEAVLKKREELSWNHRPRIFIAPGERSSDDYGPVYTAGGRFDPPAPEEVYQMIHRRFGLWFRS